MSKSNQSYINKICCDAMIAEGITSPESQEGIDFCTEECPYDHCVIAEPIISTKSIERISLGKRARELRDKGCSVEEVSKLLGKSKRTVMGYLK